MVAKPGTVALKRSALIGAATKRMCTSEQAKSSAWISTSSIRCRVTRRQDDGVADCLLDGLIAVNHDEWSRYSGGDELDRKKMQRFFTGQIMKATRGQANGKVVAQLMSLKSES